MAFRFLADQRLALTRHILPPHPAMSMPTPHSCHQPPLLEPMATQFIQGSLAILIPIFQSSLAIWTCENGRETIVIDSDAIALRNRRR